MAVTYGFYNSLNKDRVYNAEQMSSIFNGIITDGVFASIGGSLMPIAGTGMQVIVKTGKCWFNSTWTLNDALLPLDIPTADVSLTRIDAVVVEINSAVSTRANTIKVIKGTPSANSAKPALANTETLHQYALGYVTVSAGATSITADKIEVNVGKTTCPFITSVLQQTDITALFNQWDAEFNTWFANVQSQLSGDIAANLQKQIDELRNAKNIKISDECADTLNINRNSSVDDAVKVTGRLNSGLGNEYLWEKQRTTTEVDMKWTEVNTMTVIPNGVSNEKIVRYADDFELIESGKIKLKNPQTLTMPSYETGNGQYVAEALRGKYTDFWNNDIIQDVSNFYYIYPDSTFKSPRYEALSASHFKKTIAQETIRIDHVESLGFLNSPNAENPPAEANGIEYVPLGRLGGFCRTEYGSYFGDGTVGPKTLTFSGKPLFMAVMAAELSDKSIIAVRGCVRESLSWENNSVTWGSSSTSARDALNEKYKKYVYFAIVR